LAQRTCHLIGICGTGMGSLAGLLIEKGFTVRGSDADPRPPVSTMLESLGIEILRGYDARNLEPLPDTVVVGNVVGRSNPEVAALLERKIPYLSMPQALGELVLEGRHPIVVAGTHGKTTTSALMSHVLASTGRDPSFFVGGVIRGIERSFRLGSGPHVVVEGDEYETSFFDKGSKFLHYRPRTAILTSVDYDHAEMFPSIDAVEETFRKFIALIPADGALIVCADDARAFALASEGSAAPMVTYGLSEGELRGRIESVGGKETRFEAASAGGRARFTIPMSGEHNVLNALGVLAAGRLLGLSDGEIGAGLASFPGVHRRQEVVGVSGGVKVLDDFAHHPAAVRATIRGIRSRYPDGKLWAIFEPRTNTTRRSVFQADYAAAFDGADEIVIAPVHDPEKAPEGQRLDVGRLVSDLAARGLRARRASGVEEIVAEVAREARRGDVLLVMSNGAFGGIHRKLLDALEAKERNAGLAAEGAAEGHPGG